MFEDEFTKPGPSTAATTPSLIRNRRMPRNRRGSRFGAKRLGLGLPLVIACATGGSPRSPVPRPESSWAQVVAVVGDLSNAVDDDHAFDDVIRAQRALMASDQDLSGKLTLALSYDEEIPPSPAHNRVAHALRDWHRRGAAMPAGHCMSSFKSTFELHQAARLTLVVSEPHLGAPGPQAVLALSKALRERGTLIQGLIGYALLQDVVQWTSTRGLQHAGQFSGHEVTPQELARLLAREYVCALSQAEQGRGTTTEVAYMGSLLEDARAFLAPKILALAQEGRTLAWIINNADFRAPSDSLNLLLKILGGDLRSPLAAVQRAQVQLSTYLRDGPQEKPRPLGMAEPPVLPTAATFSLHDVRREENIVFIPRREVDRALSNLSRVATTARLIPFFENGEPAGFKIFAIRAESIFAQLGLKDGDVITHWCGLEITTPERALQAYGMAKTAESMEVRLLRHNEPLRLVWKVTGK